MSTRTSQIAVVGCGYVGMHLAEELVRSKYDVIGIKRRPRADKEQVRFLALDVSTPIASGDLPKGITHVVYAVSADNYSDDAYRAAYVDGVKNTIQALREANSPILRFLFVSSTGVYGQCQGEWVDEDSLTEPENFSGQRLLEGEREVMESGFDHVVLRFGGIYGPGRDRLIRRIREGNVGPGGGSPVYTNRIHRDDCAKAITHLLFNEDTKGLFIGVDDEPADRAEVYGWLARQLGTEFCGNLGSENEEEGPQGKRCSNRKLKASGYKFVYPTYKEGYIELIKQSALGRNSG